MKKAFVSVASHVNIYDPVDVARRETQDTELPFVVRIGGLSVFIDFDTLDTIATQAAFTREAWLRDQSGVLNGWDNAPHDPNICGAPVILGSHRLRCNLRPGHAFEHRAARPEED